MTFSIVAWDEKTGMTGVAVATKHLAVGALVPHAKAGVGAIATQAQTNPLLGIQGLHVLEHSRHTSPERLLQRLLQHDPDREQRQLHLVNRHGQTAAWTGKDWHRLGRSFYVFRILGSWQHVGGGKNPTGHGRCVSARSP